jgi:hypothetical protein
MAKGKRQSKQAFKNKVKDEHVTENALNIGIEAPDMESLAYAVRGADVTEPIPLGVVPDLDIMPKTMRAWVIRKDRHGEPMKSFQEEVMPVPDIGPNEVLVLVMAAGVNYNGIWAGLGEPLSVLDVHKESYHIAGSDASGIVWKVGSNVKSWKPGDEVILHWLAAARGFGVMRRLTVLLHSSQRFRRSRFYQSLSILRGKRRLHTGFVILQHIEC